MGGENNGSEFRTAIELAQKETRNAQTQCGVGSEFLLYLAYTEYQSHCVLWPMETQSPGSSAAACSPPRGANCPKCL